MTNPPFPPEGLPTPPEGQPAPGATPWVRPSSAPSPADEQATRIISNPSAPQQAPNPGPPHNPGPPPQPASAAPADPAPKGRLSRLLRDPLSILLVLVIVVALVIAGALGGELYARWRADSVIAQAAECVMQDGATVSFGVVPPFLWQHINGDYTNIRIQSAGNQLRQAKGMKVDLVIKDVHLQETDTAGGTLGSLDADITWTKEGINQTVQADPILGALPTTVTTNPAAGTIQLQGPLGKIITKPQVVPNAGLSLQVLEISGLGFSLPPDLVQPTLDKAISAQTKNFPMGIHADSVQVTDSGVKAHFSTQNATLPKKIDDPCFAGL
jgi:hypothetical protein